MPSQILHVLFGEDLLAALYPAPEGGGPKWDGACRGAFALGCQGPDVFYHGRSTRPFALEYGGLLHRRGYGTFCARLLEAALPAAGRPETNALEAYALGFLSHAALDRHCHPYIVYKSAPTRNADSGNRAEASLFHPFFERILDVLMLRELRRREAEDWNQGLLAETCANPPPGLRELIVRAMVAAFPEKAAGDEKLAERVAAAFADSARFYALTDPAKTRTETLNLPAPLSRRFLSVVYPVGLSAGVPTPDVPGNVDFLNAGREPWYYPYRPPTGANPEPDTRSFPEVYADALKAAAKAVRPCVIRNPETGSLHFETVERNIGNEGLSILNEEGKPCAPNLSAPLPLGAVLDRQCRIRKGLANLV